jgi:hypothetical protein
MGSNLALRVEIRNPEARKALGAWFQAELRKREENTGNS